MEHSNSRRNGSRVKIRWIEAKAAQTEDGTYAPANIIVTQARDTIPKDVAGHEHDRYHLRRRGENLVRNPCLGTGVRETLRHKVAHIEKGHQIPRALERRKRGIEVERHRTMT